MDQRVELSDAEMDRLWQLAAAMQADYNHNFAEAFAAAVKKRDQLVGKCHGSGMFVGEGRDGKIYVCYDEGRWSLRIAPFDY